ncbi:MAG: hypothetical protein OWS74_07075 [Firmicutes bacterium]|nr:hypothetical protein [Bacillota bacterium]
MKKHYGWYIAGFILIAGVLIMGLWRVMGPKPVKKPPTLPPTQFKKVPVSPSSPQKSRSIVLTFILNARGNLQWNHVLAAQGTPWKKIGAHTIEVPQGSVVSWRVPKAARPLTVYANTGQTHKINHACAFKIMTGHIAIDSAQPVTLQFLPWTAKGPALDRSTLLTIVGTARPIE